MGIVRVCNYAPATGHTSILHSPRFIALYTTALGPRNGADFASCTWGHLRAAELPLRRGANHPPLRFDAGAPGAVLVAFGSHRQQVIVTTSSGAREREQAGYIGSASVARGEEGEERFDLRYRADPDREPIYCGSERHNPKLLLIGTVWLDHGPWL